MFLTIFFGCWMWQMMLSHLVYNHWMLLANVICHVVVSWLMFFAIVAEVIATFLFVCGRWKPHLNDILTVAEVMATIWIGWCYCHCGGWNYHICMGWCFTQCSRWNSQICDSWCVCCGRWNGHFFLWLADVIAIVADGIATGWNVFKAELITLLADVKATGSLF